MKSVGGRTGWATIAVALLFPALAFALHVTGGAFTSTQADIHVAKGGGKIVNAQINCKLQGGQTLVQIQFQKSIKVKASGSFAYHGQAFYITFGNHRSKMVTASISGKFVTSKQVKGNVNGGPGACHSVRFAAAYNPSAH